MQTATLVLVLKEEPMPAILLGYKKKGFGTSKLSGFGGKVKAGETILAAAARELAEETGLQVPLESLHLAAILAFRFPYENGWSQDVYVFTTDDTGQEPVESEEMRPQWFSFGGIPYDHMWADGRHWLPRILAGEQFRATFYFRPDNASLERFEFTPISPSTAG
jgi:8-oxo-dGTP pyrophosphatase MutT (NUDIX family)